MVSVIMSVCEVAVRCVWVMGGTGRVHKFIRVSSSQRGVGGRVRD